MTRQADRALRLDTELNEITRAERPALIALWREHYGRPPPKNLSVPMMRASIGHAIQERACGGHRKATLRTLASITRGSRASEQASSISGPTRVRSSSPDPAPRAQVGTELIREWNGRTHRVTVTEAGFMLEGRIYRSLSAVARHITGAHWSGPRFFGVAASTSTTGASRDDDTSFDRAETPL